MKTVLLKLFVIFLFVSCNSKRQELQGGILKIDLTEKREIITLSADSVFSAASYVALESTEKSLIYGIDKIKVDKNGDFYIMDQQQLQLVIFDKQGNYKWRLRKVGQGPGEYLSIRDFIVENGYIYILTGVNILVYDKLGEFTEKIELAELYCNEFVFTTDYIYLYSAFQSLSFKNIFVMDRKNKKLLASYMDFPAAQKGVSPGSNILFQTPTSLYATFPYKYGIYKLEKDKYEEILQVDFPYSKIYSAELQNSSFAKRNEYRFKLPDYEWPIDDISDLIVHENTFIFSFIYCTSRHTVFYNTNTKKMMYGYVLMSPSFPIVRPVFQSYQNGQIIQVVPPEYLYDLKENTDINKNIKKLYTTEDSNPILAIYDLKL